MKVMYVFGMSLWFSAAQAQASVVAGSNITLTAGGAGVADSDYTLTIFQDEAATGGTSIFFDYDGTVISVLNSNIGEASDWYHTADQDDFSASTIAGDVHPFLIRVGTGGGFDMADLTVGSNFFLGANTGNDQDTSGEFPPRNVFGWVHLRNQFGGGGLTIVDNAVTYMGSGIIVNTTTAIPEASIAHLLLLSLAICARRRR